MPISTENVQLILTGCSTVAICVAAVAALLTWFVYRQIRDLASTSNQILDRTAAISADMLTETRSSRLLLVRPEVRLETLTRGSRRDGRMLLAADLVNDGAGIAYDVRIDAPSPQSGSEEGRALLRPAERVRVYLAFPDEGPPGQDIDLPPFPVRILYRDRYGTLLETTQKAGMVVSMGHEVRSSQAGN